MGFQSDVNSLLSTAALGIGGVKHIKEQKEQGKSLEGLKKSIEEYEKKYPLNETSVERVPGLKDEETGEIFGNYSSVGRDNRDSYLEKIISNTLTDFERLQNTEYNPKEDGIVDIRNYITPDNTDYYNQSMGRVQQRSDSIYDRQLQRKQPSFELPISEEESRYAGINPNRHINRKGGK